MKMIRKLKTNFIEILYFFLIFSLVISICVPLWFYFHRLVDTIIELEFITFSEQISHQIEDSVEIYSNILLAARACYQASEGIDRDEWDTFFKEQNLHEKYPGFLSLNYVEKVLVEEKDEFVKKIREEGFTDFDIHPADGSEKEYFVVNYIEPFEENKSAFGFNLASDPRRLAALQFARDTKNFSSTAPIVLYFRPNQAGSAFLVMLAVYDNNKPSDTLVERRTNLKGFIVGAFNSEILFSSILDSDLSPNILFSLTDNGEEFFSAKVKNDDYLNKDDLVFKSSIYVGGRSWQLITYPTKSFFSSFRVEKFLPNLILIAGFLLGVFLYIIVYIIIRSHKIAKKVANEMTENFNKEKVRVEEINRDLQEALSIVEVNLKERDQKQKVIINILEDVEEEKKIIEKLAKDLEKFKLAVDNVSDQIVITDSNGIIIYANQGLQNITGYKVKEVLDKKVGTKNLWGGMMGQDFYKNLWHRLAVEKKPFIGDIKNRRKNGKMYEARAYISPILDSAGQVLFYVAIERDVTIEKEIDRMKTEFVSVASHQLRTPLSAVKWYLEMLLAGDAGKINKEQEDFLHQAYDSNERMIALVNGLLNVSRIEAGRLSIEPKVTDIIQLSQTVIGELMPLIQKNKIKFKFLKSGKLPLIKVDSELISQVIMNLLSNAIKYTPAGGKVDYKVELLKNEIKFIVKDTGLGIPNNQQKRIFERFFRADNVIVKDTEGTGLGLYVAKSVVELSGGKIDFVSRENKGSTFWFTLPLTGSKRVKGEVKLEKTKI